MSEPFNILLFADAGPRLFHARSSAQTLAHDLFWGRDAAHAFIETALHEGELDSFPGLLDGGAIIDEPRTTLLVWSDGEEAMDVPLRRIFMRLLAALWTGWEVRWASAEDLHRYLRDVRGWSESEAYAAFCPDHRYDLEDATPARTLPSWRTAVLSLRRPGGKFRFYTGRSEKPPIIARRKLESAWSTAPASVGLEVVPWSGTHIDLQAQTVEFWSAALLRMHEAFAERLPGFRVTDLGDAFERQVDLCEGRLLFPVPSEASLFEQWRSTLLAPSCCTHVPLQQRERLFAEASVRASIEPSGPYR
jgi:hypothetical protein